ncbi:multiubiquitin domain-containing protein [Bradyrhizobium yuanmingense]|uniref:multiubiquitin domain-containing protein n=1 Tax=Bradyrhizobium yuanmingense TaxID=108015 RepID=UPI0023B904C6|nr:multiubiquitin domain-containing protein [Bradyrhizobium yuanmingense]MDF0498163.1 multiubiquitin domain-containing protein [Bradyrhizobium yuanmingense]
MSDDDKHAVVLNGEKIEVPSAKVTGIQLRLLGAIPAGYELITEGRGNDPDRVLTDTDVLDLSGPIRHVFAKPPTAFGSPIDASCT